MKSKIGDFRTLTNPATGQRGVDTVIRDEIYFPKLGEPPYDAGEWGEYVFGAWLEEDASHAGSFLISFPYYRNGRFAGQYSLRAEPWIVEALCEEMKRRGWFKKPSYSTQ